MKIDENIINDLIEIYRVYYNITLSKSEAQDICERIVYLFEGLARSGMRPPDLGGEDPDAETRS